MDLKKLQERIFELKKSRGYNTEDIYLEFCYLQEEASEAFNAYHKKKPDLDLELADIAIYLFGLAQMLDVDLQQAILKKFHINSNRIYELIDGVHVRTKEANADLTSDQILEKYNLK